MWASFDADRVNVYTRGARRTLPWVTVAAALFAVEVGRDVWLWGTERDPDVLVMSSQDSTISRWQVNDDGSLTQDAMLTFVNLGSSRSREARGSTSLYLENEAALQPHACEPKAVVRSGKLSAMRRRLSPLLRCGRVSDRL
jgi:hypothetical protein